MYKIEINRVDLMLVAGDSIILVSDAPQIFYYWAPLDIIVSFRLCWHRLSFLLQ